MHAEQLCTETELCVYKESQRFILLIFPTSVDSIQPHILLTRSLPNAGVSDS